MTDDVKTEPCLKGLTPACFKAHPDYAKRVFAYRLLMLLIGEELLKRLQTIPGGIFQRLLITLPEIPGFDAFTPEALAAAPLTTIPGIPGPAELVPETPSAIPPIYIPPWEPGPINPPEPEPEEPAMPAIHKAVINIATAATHEIIAAVAGFKISIASVCFTVAGECNITLLSAATPISGAMDFGGTNEPRGKTHTLGEHPLQTGTGEAFNITLSAAVQVSGYVTYYLS